MFTRARDEMAFKVDFRSVCAPDVICIHHCHSGVKKHAALQVLIHPKHRRDWTCANLAPPSLQMLHARRWNEPMHGRGTTQQRNENLLHFSARTGSLIMEQSIFKPKTSNVRFNLHSLSERNLHLLKTKVRCLPKILPTYEFLNPGRFVLVASQSDAVLRLFNLSFILILMI